MKKIYIAITFMTICLSCNDFLETTPDESIAIKEQLSNKTGILQALNGMYKEFSSFITSEAYLYGDFQGGNISFTPTISSSIVTIPNNITSIYNFEDTSSTSTFTSRYEDLYSLINQTNLLLEYVDGVADLTDSEKNQLKAECLSARAYAHYWVSLLYAQQYSYTSNATHLGIVCLDHTLNNGVEFPSRRTMAETYVFIKKDLDEALSLFTDTQAINSGASNSYFNTITTQAIYAQIALQMSDWATAENFATQVISTSGKTLTTQSNYITEWEDNTQSPTETVFEFTRSISSDDFTTSFSLNQFYGYTSDTNHGLYVASSDIRNLYTTDDVRLQLFTIKALVTNTNGTTSSQNYYFTKKFQGDPNTVIARLSEMYLINAEAKARQGKTSDALADLNAIHTRAGLSALTNTSNILDEIFIERRKELAFEGKLLFDIARFQYDITRGADCISTQCSLNYPANQFILPIPISSINNNENIIQNEGY